MIHLTDAISDLGFILITAAAVTLLFRILKQPVVLGYLIAGILVGPHVDFTPSIVDTTSVKVWAEVGVIFLLFGLGLEFSFKKLAQVGRGASIIAFVEVIFMMGVGYLAGSLMGWTGMDSLFLGGILAISSTTIIVRAFDELGLKAKSFVSLVFGVLVIEDLFAILLLALLSTVAATKSLSGTELLVSSLKLAFYLVLWFVVGIYFLPVLLRKMRPILTDETVLVVAVGLCLVMVMHATAVGFSPELGAFVMGSILAETGEGKRIEHLIVPVRNLFAAVFFVSVGMLIDPAVIIENWPVILVLTLITIVGKFFGTAVGALLSGYSLKQSVSAGLSLAQIGEFSFIIATLGLTLGVTSDFLYPFAVSISAITTFTTPYFIKAAEPFCSWLDKKLPAPLANRLYRYHTLMSARSAEGTFSLLWNAYGLKLLLNGVVVLGLTFGAKRFLDQYVGHVVSALVCLFASAPFFWAIVFGSPHLPQNNPAAIEKLKGLQFGIALFRTLLAIALAAFVVSQFTSILAVSGLILFLVAVLFVVLSSYAESFYNLFESRFMYNLKETEPGKPARPLPTLAPWDANLAKFQLSTHSELVAHSLEQSRLKERFGATVALIERGGKRILAPGRQDLLLPGDQIYLIGADDQLESARAVIEGSTLKAESDDLESFGLESMLLTEKSPFVEKPIRTCGLREAIHGLIVGIERDGKRIVSPDSGTVLKPKDLIWVVGDRKLIRQVSQSAA